MQLGTKLAFLFPNVVAVLYFRTMDNIPVISVIHTSNQNKY